MTAAGSRQPRSGPQTLIACAFFLSIGILGFMHIENQMRNSMFPFTVFFGTVTAILVPRAILSKRRMLLLWTLIAMASCLFLDVKVTHTAELLLHNANPMLFHQFGWRVIYLFAFVFLWIFITPTDGLRKTTNIRRLLLGTASLVASLQVVWSIQLFQGLQYAQTIEQARSPTRLLLYIATAQYLFLISKVLLANSMKASAGETADENPAG